jgi:hypothetical protein
MTTSTTDDTAVPALGSGRRRQALRAAAVLAATVAAAAVWMAAVPLAGVELEVEMNGRPQSVELGAVVGVSLTVGLLGWALLALLERRSRRAAAIWTGVALAVAALSLVGPVTAAVTAVAAAVLVALHVVVAAVLVSAMRRSASGRRS